MIPVTRIDVLDAGVAALRVFALQTGAKGRFVALYLGLRRMAELVAPLGSNTFTPSGEIEDYLDRMWTKTHREEVRRVLTAPFGGSPSNNGYSARTGQIPPGKKYPTNTWRNNFGIQKGIGCGAEASIIPELLANPERRMSCPHMRFSDEAGHVCGVTGTSYRGEEHSIWLAYRAPNGYQVADLDLPSVYEDYLYPSGQKIPIFPLIAVLYALALPDFYPQRSTVSIPDFAADFGYELPRVESIFECDPGHELNALILSLVEGSNEGINAAENIIREAEAFGSALPTLTEAALINNGVGAEIAVANDLAAQGWAIQYTGNQALLGYDLRAENRGTTLKVEVKSSVGFTTPELTQSEWDAAQKHDDLYILAVVDFYGSDRQSIWYVRNPAETIEPSVRTSAVYRLARKAVEEWRTDVDFL